jgi:hypothetical protein
MVKFPLWMLIGLRRTRGGIGPMVLGLVVVGPTAHSVIGRQRLVSNGSYTWHKLVQGVEPVENGPRGRWMV